MGDDYDDSDNDNYKPTSDQESCASGMDDDKIIKKLTKKLEMVDTDHDFSSDDGELQVKRQGEKKKRRNKMRERQKMDNRDWDFDLTDEKEVQLLEKFMALTFAGSNMDNALPQAPDLKTHNVMFLRIFEWARLMMPAISYLIHAIRTKVALSV